MATGINPLLRVCLAGSAIGGLIAFAFPATAQWAPPPWRTAWPGEIERDLEAQGYVLTAPLMRRPGVYLADVSTGPGGNHRLIIDARSGQVLESFPASSRFRGPVLADRDEGFGEPQPGVEQRLSAGSSGALAAVPPSAKSTYGRPASVHIPAAISPYGPATAPGGARPKTKVASTEHKISGAKAAATMNPPLPPPAPREAAKAEEPGPPTSKPPDNHHLDQPEADIAPPAVAPTTTGSSAEASDKSKVSIVPPALFE